MVWHWIKISGKICFSYLTVLNCGFQNWLLLVPLLRPLQLCQFLVIVCHFGFLQIFQLCGLNSISPHFPSIYLSGFWIHLLMVRLWLGLVVTSSLVPKFANSYQFLSAEHIPSTFQDINDKVKSARTKDLAAYVHDTWSQSNVSLQVFSLYHIYHIYKDYKHDYLQ